MYTNKYSNDTGIYSGCVCLYNVYECMCMCNHLTNKVSTRATRRISRQSGENIKHRHTLRFLLRVWMKNQSNASVKECLLKIEMQTETERKRDTMQETKGNHNERRSIGEIKCTVLIHCYDCCLCVHIAHSFVCLASVVCILSTFEIL